MWLVAVVASMYLNDEHLTAVLMPLWIPVGSLAGPGLNIGSAKRPRYEATPVHAVCAQHPDPLPQPTNAGRMGLVSRRRS